MRTGAGDRIDTHTGYMLVRLGVAAAALFDDALIPLNLRGRHVKVMGHIHDGTPSQQDLCRLTGMDRTTMVAVVDDLERLGHARRERSATDRRKHVVILTAEGAAALTEALRLLAEAQEELLSPLPAAERDQFHDLVSRLFAARAGE
ncbi:MarR family winged helix-turn-helix transcriptional regulator [Planobispora longispora]|uniref:MarR family transcriptional regulator n=1 Tax=Planobispora longispora TaxID=28887 RepID=A0A8J3RMD5_9ACTN|nr:MarR family winged helix-turn-helix transcriptional regulator [Planobispora longispora]GIH76254.1 MarR family transcriptional regulator [Planobispora longispora]